MFELELAYALEKNSMPVPDFLYKHSVAGQGMFAKLKAGMRSQINKSVAKSKSAVDDAFALGSKELMNKLKGLQGEAKRQAISAHRATKGVYGDKLTKRMVRAEGLEGKGLLRHAGEYARTFKGRAAAAGVGTLAVGGGVYAGGRSLNQRRKRRRALGM